VAAGPRDLLASSLGGLARTLERAATASTYVAAGLLRFEALERHMATNWRHFGLAQSDPDVAEGLFSWEQRFYARFLTAGERVLIVGCGSGRDLVPLLEQGYRAAALPGLYHVTATGGRILISYVLAAPAARRLPWQLARLAARLSRSDWRPEYGDVFLPRADTGCIHYEHRFRPEEIEAEARDAGLAVTGHEHDGDGNLALRVARADGP
jgi:SAM-dependent methyltransferase